MMLPVVSFVVPCFKLAHLLRDCVDSILSQTYQGFEVLIMDDCSPDHTEMVVSSYRDERICYIKNESNLGHLRNYNKGIELSRGRYVWLISADDFLKSDRVLEKYVELLERNPDVGFTFCPGVSVDGKNGFDEWLEYGRVIHGEHDKIIPGHLLLTKLLKENTIVAASGLVRKSCYERLGGFPLDMPWAGDWYLWCLFSLYYDVGYFAEPMVCYREHADNMTHHLLREHALDCCEEDTAIPWIIKRKSDEIGFNHVSKACLEALATIYARDIISRSGSGCNMIDLDRVEKSIMQGTNLQQERDWVRGRMYEGVGDACYRRGDIKLARWFYQRARITDWRMFKVWVKGLLLSLGAAGSLVRRGLG